MTRKKKSGFLTLCFSLLPGAGEMYLGFMKMGVSLMGLFFGVWVVAMLLNIYYLLVIEVVLWFYSFFHVHNLAGLTDQEFLEVKDEYLFNLDIFLSKERDVEKYRKIIAAALIIIGFVLLWNGLKSAFMPWIPNALLRFISRFENTIARMIVGIGIIIAGVRMIRGKEEELREVIIDVDAADVKGQNEMRTASGTATEREEERTGYGAETERKDS